MNTAFKENTDGLLRMEQFVAEMKATSSSNAKKKIIEKWKDDEWVSKAVLYTGDPFKKFHVTSVNCLKNRDKVDNEGSLDIWDVFDRLADRTLSGHDAIAVINNLIQVYGHNTLIYNILDKNLKIRANSTLFNKVVGGWIPTFDVALAKPYESKRCNFETEDWYCSRKLDGCRCIAIYTHATNSVVLYSRVGNVFTTLDVLTDEILNLDLITDVVFDGEVCMMDKDGKEDFQGIMKEIKKKDHTIEHPKYIIFDMLTKDEFDEQRSVRILSDRQDDLFGVFEDREDKTAHLSVLPQFPIENDDVLLEHIKDAEKNGFEGVMVRRNVGYEGKRTFNLMKVKQFNDAEFVVKSIGTAIHRILVPTGGTMVEDETVVLAQVVIEYKGEEVEVGSGWSQQQRIRYAKHPEEIIGKVITVQWFEETVDKNGKISLRFPTVKHVHGDKREV